jgi:hypothetical protein
MVDGDPGQGKSLILLDLAARLTSGRPFPECAAGAEPSGVVIVNAEDRARETIHSRLVAAGADLARAMVWQRQAGEPWLHLPREVRQLDDIIASTRAKLVLLDPLMAFLDPTINVGSDVSVRQALTPVADLAERHGCAIVLIRHLNKRGGRALYRGLASIGFTALCRVAWFVGPDPKAPNRYVLAQAKNNLDPLQPSLSYQIEATPSAAEAVDATVPRIRWLGASVWGHDDLVAAQSSRRRLRSRAAQFLALFLKDGPKLAQAVHAAGHAHRLTKRTLERAAGDLGISFQRIGALRDQQCYWRLPGPTQDPPSDDDQVLESWLRRLHEQFPSCQ